MTCEQVGAEVDFYLEELSVRVTRAWLGWALVPWYLRGFMSGWTPCYLAV